jgi:methylated-DNA-protein-cysteine methyltransferase related protein
MAKQHPQFFTYVYRLVSQVPKGKVITYGQVAALLGAPRAARAVGTALRYLPQSLSHNVFRVDEQRWLLESEGIEFDRSGKINLKKSQWAGPKQKIKTPKWKEW